MSRPLFKPATQEQIRNRPQPKKKFLGAYVLDGRHPVEAVGFLAGASALERDRRVAMTKIGKVQVSTVFLGVDHNFFDEGETVLFETMVFGGEYDDAQERYSTYAEAEQGHTRWVNKVKRNNE
jgi:hypothetical protein